jgi:long-chain acyl-CoA synthetase
MVVIWPHNGVMIEAPRVRTIAELWREGAAQRRAWPAYLVEQDDRPNAVSWDEPHAASRISPTACWTSGSARATGSRSSARRARLMHLGGPHIGYTIAFLPDPLRVLKALSEVGPQVFPSVPRFYEKIHAGVVQGIEDAAPAKRRSGGSAAGRCASATRSAGCGRRESRCRPRWRCAIVRRIASSSRRSGRASVVGCESASPAARRSRRTSASFFHAIGILVIEGYGLTECTAAVTVNRPNAFRFGTAGQALPGVELALAEDGELLVGGETVFAGYLKDPAATHAVLDDEGWLRTGDIAAIDADGFVTITDRKKDIIVTAGGEGRAGERREPDQALARRLAGARARRPQAVRRRADHCRPRVRSAGRLRGGTRGRAGAVDAANAELSRHEQVKRFELLPRDFSAQEGEVTPTLKLKRRVLEQRYTAEIERLYA